VQALIRAAGVGFTLNPRLVRGLDYYNLTVTEWVTDRLGAQATVCAGGRYDCLVEQCGGKPQPACGFALGVERLILLVKDTGTAAAATPADVYLVHQGDAAQAYAWAVGETLRDRGLRVIQHCGGGGFKAQRKKADASGALYAVVIGDDEAAARTVALKPLRAAGEQMQLAVEAAADRIKRST
jgi:histidyl-tRNA synthetase